MKQSWLDYRQTLTKELGEKLANEFVESLYRKSNGDEKKAAQFFYELGSVWAPIMQAWSLWIEENAQGTIAIILRDAKPLTVLPSTENWQHLYLNRLICGVPDELSGHDLGDQQPLLDKYLKQSGCSEYFTFVDSGCYGTVVLELHKLGMRFKPLFFFSKNPYIQGFVNECGLSEQEGEILNDSLECAFPHIYDRPSQLVEIKGRVEPSLHLSDHYSVEFGRAAMRGMQDAATTQGTSGKDSAKNLLALSKRAAQGEFTGVLGQTSPEWTKKKQFLENWPADLRWNQ